MGIGRIRDLGMSEALGGHEGQALGGHEGQALWDAELHRLLAIRSPQKGDRLNNYCVNLLKKSHPSDSAGNFPEGDASSCARFGRGTGFFPGRRCEDRRRVQRAPWTDLPALLPKPQKQPRTAATILGDCLVLAACMESL